MSGQVPQSVVWKQNAQNEFSLIATSRGVHWNVQKDLSERGDTTSERALNETQEEVGLSSTIIDETLKFYLHATWERVLRVAVSPVRVTDAADTRPEQSPQKILDEFQRRSRFAWQLPHLPYLSNNCRMSRLD